jgi:hypothetical protein
MSAAVTIVSISQLPSVKFRNRQLYQARRTIALCGFSGVVFGKNVQISDAKT